MFFSCKINQAWAPCNLYRIILLLCVFSLCSSILHIQYSFTWKDKNNLLGFTVGIVVSGLTATKAPLFDMWPKERALGILKSEFKCHEKEFSPGTGRWHNPTLHWKIYVTHPGYVFSLVFFPQTVQICAKLSIRSFTLLKPKSFLLADSMARAFLGNKTSAVHVSGMTEHQVD